MTARPIKATNVVDSHHADTPARPVHEMESNLRWRLSEQSKNRLVCLVAEINDQTVASGKLALLGNRGEIGSLIVAPDHRQQGIGTALVLALIEHAKQRHVHTLEISAHANTPWIRAWYERLGFTFQCEHDFPNERVAILTMNLTQGDPT